MEKHEEEQVQENRAQDVPAEQPILVMRNIMDNQLETCDNIEIGRVADIEAVWRSDGKLILTTLLAGPEALAGRLSSYLRPLVHFFLRGHFEHGIPITEIDDFEPTLCLHGKATDYPVGQSDRWIANHILRWIPGSGWRKWHEQQQPGGHPRQPAQPHRTHPTCTVVRIEDLIGSKIVTGEGERLGHVVDIHVTCEREPEAVALVYGESGWLYRLGVLYPFSQVLRLKFKSYTVPWQAIEKFEHLTVTLKAGYKRACRTLN